MRVCTKCKQEKEDLEFSSWKDKKTGKIITSTRCKECVAEYSRTRYKAKRDKISKQSKDNYAQNREKFIEKSKAYYKANREKVLERHRQDYAANRSTYLIKCAEWKAKNPEKVYEMQKRWVNANRDKVRVSANKYAQKEEIKKRVKERQKLLKLQAMEGYGGPICACCGETMLEALTFDHINNDGAEHRAVIGKGSQLYKWLIDNDCPPGFQVLCMNCNLAKYRNGGVCPHKDHKS